MKKYIMALDQGTTSSRCILFNKKGEIVSTAQKEYPQIYPQPGWVEHNPMEIWSSQLSVATEAMILAGASSKDISAIGITNQRETTIVWDKNTGMPVYNAIVWQCRRTAQIVESISPEMKEYIRDTTGLIPDAYFSATKIKWILDNVKGAREKAKKGDLIFGTVDTWLLWNLTEGSVHATDYTNASRTMLFDIKKLQWDKKILDYFDIPESMMPAVHPSGYEYGYTLKTFSEASVPITGMAGDQQASLFGLGCFEPGDAKNTYGTGGFLLLNTGHKAVKSENGLVTTIICGFDDKVDYALEGSIFIAGAVIQWLRDELKFMSKASESEYMAKSVENSNGVYLVPAFTGLGAPYWKQDARGIIVGLTRGANKDHITRAAVESIAFQVHDVIRAMEKDAGFKLKVLKVDGGASANDFLMQFQSDIVNSMLSRPLMLENTALGAAYVAGLTSGYWKDKAEILDNMKDYKNFAPNMPEAEREQKLKGWNRAVKTAIVWAEEE